MSIDITEAAAKHILEYLHKNALAQPVRLMLKARGGCGDLSPAFHAGVSVIPDEDEVLDKHGLSLVCNLSQLPELDGVTVDLRVDAKDMSKVLVLQSATLESCGCGQAVTPKKK
jgi:Fe-S cluster assembly iron-binding protein IscA